MFDELLTRWEKFIRDLRGQGKLSEANVRDTVREIRRILLEADVSLPAAKAFVEAVQAKSLGRDVLSGVAPGQQMVKVIYDELVVFLGGAAEPIQFGKSPSPILMVGLNGVGKTTTAAKLALHLKRKGRHPLLVVADTRRPAAIEQLQTLGAQFDIPVFFGDRSNPIAIYQAATVEAKKEGLDCIIVDSAGRQHVDAELMGELTELQQAIKPPETLLVVDGMTGQDAVKSAQAFLEKLELTGLVLTKLDGDTRGGAALSIRWVTGRPIKFIGLGEKPADLEPFHPERMAGRILGMGDVVTLVEKAQEAVDAQSALRFAEKVRKQELNLEDFKEQLTQLRKMGPLESVLSLLPGMKGALKNTQVDDGEFKSITAIIDSMTPGERRNPRIIDGSRRRRIARGSGRSVQEINRLLNQFEQMRKMMKMFGGKHGKRLPPGFPTGMM